MLENGTKTIDKFAQSDMMPTYLVSFAVIDFEKISNETSIYTITQENIELVVSLILDVSKKSEELYPLKRNKVDYIIVPDYSLSKNVLSSIGLNLLRTSAVLFNENTNRTEDKQLILKSISYAVVKQTYENKNTPNWWKHFWIDEGILRCFQYEIFEALKPEWRLLDQFIVQDLHSTLHYDTDNQAISVMINENDSPDNLSEHFYTKSFSLMRMLQNQQLPGDIMQISENSFTNFWAKFKGYPVLHAKRNFQTSFINISQNSLEPISIPFSIATQGTPDFDNVISTYILEKNEDQFDILEKNVYDWYIINKQQTGYFRVNYDEYDWWLINNYLQTNDFTSINTINRAELIDDAYNLAYKGFITYNVFLNTIRYIEKEDDFIPLYTFFKLANSLKSLLAYSKAQNKFLSYINKHTQHLFEKVGTEVFYNDSHITRLKRISVLTWLCNFNNEKCQQRMRDILSQQKNVHPDLQEPVYCGGMRLSSLENFEYLLGMYKDLGDIKILKYMGCTSNSEILRYYLEGILNETIIVHLKPEHSLNAFIAVIEGSDTGVDIALSFIKQNLEDILEKFDKEIVAELFTILSSKLVTLEQLTIIDEMIACLSRPNQTKYEPILQNAKDKVAENIEWRNKHLNFIDDWLNHNCITTSTSTTTTTTSTSISTSTAATTTSPNIIPPSSGTVLTNNVLCNLVFMITYIFLILCS